MGPFLFSIYINDCPQSATSEKSISFTGDTAFEDMSGGVSALNHNLLEAKTRVKQWLLCILFFLTGLKATGEPVTFLGVFLDSTVR